MTAAIEIRGVCKTFGTHKAVDGLDITVEKGAIFGLLGRNGAGKSTTIRMVMDIIRPDEGEILVLGDRLTDATKDLLGYLPEERGLYPKMKVLDLLQFQGSIKGLSLAEAKARGSKWIDRLELGPWKLKKVEELSKGMQQKVQFAAAVMHEPEIVILDEPFSGMDPVNQELFKDLILEMHGKGSTIVFSTHVMASAEQLCKEIALIDKGKTVLSGTLPAIRERYGTNTVRIRIRADNSFLDSLPGVSKVDRFDDVAELHLEDGALPQTILEQSIGRGSIDLFEKVQPTLHNIFIQEVGQAADAEIDQEAARA